MDNCVIKEARAVIKDAIDFREVTRSEIIFRESEWQRKKSGTERQTDIARSVTFPFIRSSRRRLPGPDNEWMSKTQQLIQPCGEQRRKNTVDRRLVLERSSSSTGDSPRQREMRRWMGRESERRLRRTTGVRAREREGGGREYNWQWGSNERRCTIVGSSNFTLLIVIQFHGASACSSRLPTRLLARPLPYFSLSALTSSSPRDPRRIIARGEGKRGKETNVYQLTWEMDLTTV